jgi:hypothetical protein
MSLSPPAYRLLWSRFLGKLEQAVNRTVLSMSLSDTLANIFDPRLRS